MNHDAKTVEEYLNNLTDERRRVVGRLRDFIIEALPNGFEEKLVYGMITYVVPKSIYPNGYRANPKQPLPFLSLAAQKNHIAIYHMAIYSQPDLLAWYKAEYSRLDIGRPDLGKSCLRFKNLEKIPYGLIGELCRKVTPEQFVEIYEQALKQND